MFLKATLHKETSLPLSLSILTPNHNKTLKLKKVSARTVLFWFSSSTLLYCLLPHTIGHDNSFSFFALFSTWEHGLCKKKCIPVGWLHPSAWLSRAPLQHSGRTTFGL